MTIKYKTEADIANLRIAGQRLAAVLEKLKQLTKPGVSSVELNSVAEKMIFDWGDYPSTLNYGEGGSRPFPAALCFSVNHEIVHGIPNETPKILREGDIVTYDLCVTHNGMVADGATTVPVGKISQENKILIKATRECLEAGIKAVRLGGYIGDIGEAIARVADQYGFAVAEDLAGHGVGFSVHEEPFVPNVGEHGTGPKIKAGLVIAIEPMLVLGSPKIKTEKDGWTISTRDGKNAAQFEHTIAITENGVEVMTEK